MGFPRLITPKASKPKAQYRELSKWQSLEWVLATNFQLQTWLLVGAIAQSLLFMITPQSKAYYAVLPALLIFLARILNAYLVHWGVLRNPYLDGSIKGKYTVIVPDEEGEFGEKAAEQKIAVLLLGTKSNHPFGLMNPKLGEAGEFAMKMYQELEDGKGDNGFLGQTAWNRLDANGCVEMTNISYWRSIEHIHEFAHSTTHRAAWAWWDKHVRELDTVGINHEIFEAPANNWEALYANFQPTGLGATTYLKRSNNGSAGGDGKAQLEKGVVSEEWLNPIVAANKGKLASANGRLGRAAQKYDASRVESAY